METARTLNAYINMSQVGSLQDNNGTWSFQYSSEWLEEGYPLSPSLPLEADPIIDKSTFRHVQNFFDNLLPEEAARKLMATDAGVNVSDRFALLSFYGAESAGAIILLPEGVTPGFTAETRELDYSALSKRIRSLPQHSLNKKSPKRMSLAGAQHKLPICFQPSEGKIFEPVGSTPSTHILKPDHNDTANYPHSVINEWFIMTLADKAGLDVPYVHYLHVPEAIYIIKRFDREISESAYDRSHILDGCQLLQLAPESKYDQCTIENLIKLANMCNQPALTRREIFSWLVFNFITGNADAHLKNLSFYTGAEGYVLTPHYDLLNTTCYGETNTSWMNANMVTELAGAKTFGDVTMDNLLNVASTMRIGSPKNIQRDILKMVNQINEGTQEIYRTLEEKNSAQPDSLKLSLGEFQQLRAIIYGPIAEACSQLETVKSGD
ncbi:HipA domain-containing protein [Neptuniibacter marinus]|uniref:HipA domain-containing protein n=1 Tax=Neptuniibacter marinus TaxID=1806670 RepID=UPI003B5C62CE